VYVALGKLWWDAPCLIKPARADVLQGLVGFVPFGGDPSGVQMEMMALSDLIKAIEVCARPAGSGENVMESRVFVDAVEAQCSSSDASCRHGGRA
jgi:hypothetical protein